MTRGRPKMGVKKVKQISMYMGYDKNYKKETLWRQKIDETGRPQGIGYFLQQKVGKASKEKRQEYNRKWRPMMEAKRRGFGFQKISIACGGCQWHHVTKNLVVAVPTEIHQRVKHKLGDGNMIEGLIG